MLAPRTKLFKAVNAVFIVGAIGSGALGVGELPAAAATTVSGLSFAATTSAGGATDVTWSISFTTSSTGALTAGSGAIVITAPTGTSFVSPGGVGPQDTSCAITVSETSNGTSGYCGGDVVSG
ncbi:MAG TPA: hypothetical protein VL961_08390, partial [Acidimicrobiales bacterium]|nr:hypothetical protein [Acidimicrobiales bacterium]